MIIVQNAWVIIGNYGAANTGDEAMLAGLLDALSSDEPLTLYVVSKRTAAPSWSTSSRVSWIRPWPLTALAALWNARGLAMGGGTHFHDDYRHPRLLRHWWYLSRIVALSAAAKLLRKKIVWLSVGVGPLNDLVTRALCRAALSFCDQVSVRDRQSLREVRALKPRARVVGSFDLAALMRRPAPAGSADRQRLGVSLIDISSVRGGSASREATFRDGVTDGLRRVLDLRAALDVSIIVLRGGSREDDVDVSRDVFDRLALSHPGRVAFVDYEDSPRAMFAHVAGCDFMLGARYHASILAYLARVPQIVIAYHRKCSDFCEHVGLSAAAKLELDDVTPAMVCERVLALVENPAVFAPALDADRAGDEAGVSLDLIRQDPSFDGQGAECVVP